LFQVDTYNNFKDNQGNQLQIGELNYASKKGKSVLSFADNVPARDIKLVLSLVVRLLLEHSSVTNDKSCIHDSFMVEIKKSSKEELTHSNLFGRFNASFAKFVVDFLAMSLLFDSFLYHNAQAAPAPWAGRHLSMDEHHLFQQNQIVLIKFCLQQNEDVAWKLFGKREFGTVGWNVSNLDSLWGKSVRYVCQLKAGVCSSYKDYPATDKGDKRKEMMWIHHFVILQLFHSKFHNEKDVCFQHEDSTMFLCKITLDKTQQYIHLYHDSSRYEWLWLGRNY
jgi:hypothetical protein